MKVEVRSIAEQLDSAVSGFAQRFQQVQINSLLAVELGRNAEIHHASIAFAELCPTRREITTDYTDFMDSEKNSFVFSALTREIRGSFSDSPSTSMP